MSIIGKIQALYLDRKQTQPIFPITKTKAVSNDEGTGLDAILEEKASKDYVQEKILEVQTGEVDLSAYAKREYVDDEIGKIDFPVDSVNGKTGEIDLSASDVGALPITGGQVTGALDVNGGVIMWKDAEGGNIDIFPPSANTLTNHWEIDSHNGELRFYVDRKTSNPNGSGIITPLRLLTDGSIEVYAKTKTRENLGAAPASHVTDNANPHGVTAAQVGARPSTWTPTAAEVGAIAATSKSLSGMSVKSWAASLTSSAWGYTNNTTTDMPAEVSASNSYAIATANVAASGGWIELRLTYVLTGYVAVAIYNYGWSEWDWVNPPMTLGVQYRTTERYLGRVVYAKLVSFGALPSATVKNVGIRGSSGTTAVVYVAGMLSDGCYIGAGYNRDRSHATSSGIYLDNTLYNIRIYTEYDCSSLTAYVLVKYTID